MKKQLSPLLQLFYMVPSALSFFLALASFISIGFFASVNQSLTIVPILLFVLFCITLMGNNIATSKIYKLRHGINPLYLVEKYPKNLEAQGKELIDQGYELKNKTDTTAHFEKKPHFSIVSVIIWALLGILPGVIYVIYYFTLKNDIVYLDTATQ